MNAEQWLSNEKAQLSLLMPSWVPSKTPISPQSAADLPGGGLAGEDGASVPETGDQNEVPAAVVKVWLPLTPSHGHL